MADLNVQPKKASLLPWILLGIGLIALIYFLARGCNDDDAVNDNNRTGADTVVTTPDNNTPDNNTNNTVAATSGWEGVNYDAPAASYEEITNKDIDVRSDDNFTIYSLGENVLFDVDKSTIRASAAENLQEISESIRKRFSTGEIRVYGFTSAPGSASYNKQLAEERAASVRSWLVQNGNISDNRISLHPVGEARPAETNTTVEGRQENRRVEIVIKGS